MQWIEDSGELKYGSVPGDDPRIVQPDAERVQTYYLRHIRSDIRSIKGWVTFVGVLALLGVAFSILSGCGTVLTSGL